MKRWLIPAILYLAATIAMMYPLILHFGSVLPHDPGDPVLNTWLLWWSTKRVPLTAAWWNAPMFYPAADVMALSELLIGLLPISAVVQWLTHNPLAAYNTVFLLSYPLSGMAAFALAWELTGRRDAALLGGLAFAFAPYRAGQLAHVQMLSYYWAPVVLLGLYRYQRTRNWRWLILFGAAWLMQSLINGYAMFHVSVFVALWIIWFGRPVRTAIPIIVAWAIAFVPLLPQLLKYREVHNSLHLVRDINEIKDFSVGITDILAAPKDLAVWGSRVLVTHTEREIFPGATILLVGLVWFVTSGTWRRPAIDRRTADEKVLIVLSAVAALIAFSIYVVGPWSIGPLTVTEFRKPFSLAVLFRLLAFLRGSWMRRMWGSRSVAGFFVIAMGVMWLLSLGPEPRLAGRPILYEAPYSWLMHLPGFDTLRVPARFAMLLALSECMLLAIAIQRLTMRMARPVLITTLIAVGLLADGWVQLRVAPMPPAGPQWPSVVAAVVEIPAGGEHDFAAIARSLAHQRPIINGFSGYFPPHYLPFLTAVSDHQLSALPDVAQGQLIGIAVDRTAGQEAVIAEQTLGRMTGVSRYGSSDRWATYVLQTRVPPSVRLGRELPIKMVVANRHNEDVGRLLDKRIETAWGSGPGQVGGEELIVDLGAEQSIGAVMFEMGAFSFGFPRDLVIDASSDRQNWRPAWSGRTAVATVHAAVADPSSVPLTIDVGQISGRYIRLQQDGEAPAIPWWVAEVKVYAPADTPTQR